MHDGQKAVYSGMGYVGIGFSANGAMVPGDAVIGLPDDATVLEYDLGGYVSVFLHFVLFHRCHGCKGTVTSFLFFFYFAVEEALKSAVSPCMYDAQNCFFSVTAVNRRRNPARILYVHKFSQP